ncbi:hypothetical protein NPIL_382181 [Nephila pilipes]|uniref:Uncharacterized protein n=1 Tax=Nephila pilipes TaxID=299642 RepID=A0A8X6PIM9_NEPPI|nr:hypothetical protein NPIL_382181 [Nephila pilipes]
MAFLLTATDFSVLMSCFCVIELFCTGTYFYTLPFIVCVISTELWVQIFKALPKKLKKVKSEIFYDTLEEFKIAIDPPKYFEIIWYETIDVTQPPRLENNPFAYAYINNPFCGKEFPPMHPHETFK